MMSKKEKLGEVTTVYDINTDTHTLGEKTKEEKEKTERKKRTVISKYGNIIVNKAAKVMTRRLGLRL